MSKKFAFIDTSSKEIGAFDPIVASMPADIAGYYFAISDENGKHLLVPDISYLKKRKLQKHPFREAARKQVSLQQGHTTSLFHAL